MPRTAASLLAYGLTWRGIEREAMRRMARGCGVWRVDAAYGAWMWRMARGCGIWCADAAYGAKMWHMVRVCGVWREDVAYGMRGCGVWYAGMTSGVWRKNLDSLTGILFFD